MLVGGRIKEERERLRYSQTEFAALGGASKSAQISWEQERSFPDARVLQAWHEAGVDAGYIVTGVRADSTLEFPVLNFREQELIENFRNTNEYGKSIIEAATHAAANSIIKPPVPSVLASEVFSITEQPSTGKKSKG